MPSELQINPGGQCAGHPVSEGQESGGARVPGLACRLVRSWLGFVWLRTVGPLEGLGQRSNEI